MKDTQNTWDYAFDQMYSTIIYYLYLTTNFQSVLANPNTNITYPPSQISPHYPIVSFQEFIDTKIAPANSAEYRKFTESMNDGRFYYQLNKQYNKYTAIQTIKNHIIYLVDLQIAHYNGSRLYFSNEEQKLIITNVDPMPFYEFTRLYSCDFDEDATPNVTDFKLLEKQIIDTINIEWSGNTMQDWSFGSSRR